MIRVESTILPESDLIGKRERVRKLEKSGHSEMAILYFMSEKNTASGTYENGEFVINLS